MQRPTIEQKLAWIPDVMEGRDNAHKTNGPSVGGNQG